MNEKRISSLRIRLAPSAASQRGASMIEAALALPIAMTLVVGMFDMGRAYFQSHVVLEAAQAGARVGALPSSSTTDVKNAAKEVLESADITTADVTSSNVGSSALRGSTTTVTVTLPFQTLGGTLIPGWSGTFNLAHTVKQRHE